MATTTHRKRKTIDSDGDSDDEPLIAGIASMRVARSPPARTQPTRLSKLLKPAVDAERLISDDEDDRDFSPGSSSSVTPSPPEDEVDEMGNLRDFVVPDGRDVEIDGRGGGDEIDSEGRYWAADHVALKTLLERQIIKEVPDISETELRDALENALARADHDIIGRYVGAKPSDTLWKIGLTPERIAELEPILDATRKAIEDEQPTMEKILASKATLAERMVLVQQYDILQNCEPFTKDHNSITLKLIRMLKDINEGNPEVTSAGEAILKLLPPDDSQAMKTRIVGLQTTDANKAILLGYLRRLDDLEPGTQSHHYLKERLEWAMSLPYQKLSNITSAPSDRTTTAINRYCVEIRARLDAELYGMEKVKDVMIQMVVARLMNPKSICTLALKSPPGCGKTAVAAAFAKAVGLPFERIALGGQTDATLFKGSQSHWECSGPSIVLRLMARMGVADGVILWDELDKLGLSRAGIEIQQALLHITDYTQNHAFNDVFLQEFTHDISGLIYIFAINDDQPIDPALKNRLTIVNVPAYSREEMKLIIAKYVLPKAMRGVGLPEEAMVLTADGASEMINLFSHYVEKQGVRPLERVARELASRINLLSLVTLPDGTTGAMKLRYAIPHFRLPVRLDAAMVHRLLADVGAEFFGDGGGVMSMYS